MSPSSPLVTVQQPPSAAASVVAASPRPRAPIPVPRHHPHPDRLGERGQATAEYALVLLGAAAIALLLAAWAAQSGQIGQLFDAIVGQLIDRAG